MSRFERAAWMSPVNSLRLFSLSKPEPLGQHLRQHAATGRRSLVHLGVRGLVEQFARFGKPVRDEHGLELEHHRPGHPDAELLVGRARPSGDSPW